MVFLHAVFCVTLSCELFLTYFNRAIIGRFGVSIILPIAKAHSFMPAPQDPVRISLVHIDKRLNYFYDP